MTVSSVESRLVVVHSAAAAVDLSVDKSQNIHTSHHARISLISQPRDLARLMDAGVVTSSLGLGLGLRRNMCTVVHMKTGGAAGGGNKEG